MNVVCHGQMIRYSFQLKDLYKKKIISLLNNYRITYQKVLISISVPSLTVKRHLASKFNFDNVFVINHGTKLNLSERINWHFLMI